MSLTSLQSGIACLLEEATEPTVWSKALPLIADGLGGIGAACFAYNDDTGGVEWATIVGPASERKNDYIERYAALDLSLPALTSLYPKGWLALAQCLPASVLRHNEWYQDFIRPSRIADALGVQVYQTGPRRIFVGVHYDTTQPPTAARDPRMHLLSQHLAEAARLALEHRAGDLKALLGAWSLDHLDQALFVVLDTGRVIDMDMVDAVLARDYGLAIRQGKLVASNPVEAQRLAALITSAGQPTALPGLSRRMLVGRAEHRPPQLVTVFPLKRRLAPDEQALVLIQVADLAAGPAPGTDFADLFGLSPAEDRFARALMEGKTFQDLTLEFRVRMPTLRAKCALSCASAGFSDR